MPSYKPYAEATQGFLLGRKMAKEDRLEKQQETGREALSGMFQKEYPDQNFSGMDTGSMGTVFAFRKAKEAEALAQKKVTVDETNKKIDRTIDVFKQVTEVGKTLKGTAQKEFYQKAFSSVGGALKTLGVNLPYDEMNDIISKGSDKTLKFYLTEVANSMDAHTKGAITKTELQQKMRTLTAEASELDKDEMTTVVNRIDSLNKELEPKKEPMRDADLIRQSLVDRLGREPSSQELLDADQQRKAEIAREGRSTSMPSSFVDPTTGNPLIFNRNTDTYEVAKIQGDGGIAPRPVNPSAAEREKTAALESLNNQLDRIEDTYKPKYVGLISGQAGRITQFTDSNEAAFRQVILDVKDSLLRARSGAQINEQEYKRLSSLVPDFTDSEPQFKGKMKSFRATMGSIVGERKEAQRKGGVKFTKPIDGQSTRTVVEQRKTKDGRILTKYSDGSIE